MCERMIWIVLFIDLLCRTALHLLAAINAWLTKIYQQEDCDQVC